MRRRQEIALTGDIGGALRGIVRQNPGLQQDARAQYQHEQHRRDGLPANHARTLFILRNAAQDGIHLRVGDVQSG